MLTLYINIYRNRYILFSAYIHIHICLVYICDVCVCVCVYILVLQSICIHILKYFFLTGPFAFLSQSKDYVTHFIILLLISAMTYI